VGVVCFALWEVPALIIIIIADNQPTHETKWRDIIYIDLPNEAHQNANHKVLD
jgi:hypothetical protein